MPFISRCIVALATTLVTAIAIAQNAPPPDIQEAPIGAFIGRYLDSSSKQNQQCPIRTYRSYDVKASAEDGLLYFAIGSTFAAQELETFGDRIGTEALATGFRGEKFLSFDHSYRRDQCQTDLQKTLGGFDWDDRGYKYVGYTVEGLVILNEQFQEVNLMSSAGGQDVVAFRNGDSYYALTSFGPSTSSQLFDVTVPASPASVRYTTAWLGYAESNTGHIALHNTDNAVRIYTAAALVSGAAAAFTFTPPPSSTIEDVASDGLRFYVLVQGPGGTGNIHVLTPSAETYTAEVEASDSPLIPATKLTYGAGYLIASGTVGASMYEIEADGLTLLGHDYLTDYNDFTLQAFLQTALPVVVDGQTMLIVAANGLGDVFELEPLSPMTVSASFAPELIDSGATAALTLTITNPRATPVTFDLPVYYPYGLSNTADPDETTTCTGGTLTATPDAASVTLSNATLPPGAACTITITLTAYASGSHVLSIPAGSIDSIENTNVLAATATLQVRAPFGPPPSLSATATSATQVRVNWGEVTGTPTYEIFRNDVSIGTTSATYFDDSVSPNTSYRYKVRTVGADGFSNHDIATTVIFTDAVLTGVVAKAVHITELRTAVNAMSALANIAPPSFTDPSLSAGTIMKAVHVSELRSALNNARTALGLAPLVYGELTIIRAADITGLRAGTQ